MRSTTVIWIGINNVGDTKDPPEFFEGNMIDSLIFMSKWLGKRSMASRFDLTIARNESDCRKAIRIRSEINDDSTNDDLLVTLQAIMAESDRENGDEQEAAK